MDSNTLEWIKKQLQQGFSENQIKQVLRQRGFNEKDINLTLNNKVGTSSNIFSILCLVFSFFIPFLSIIFGIISIRKIVNENAKGKALTFAGLLISTIPYILINTFFLIYFSSMNIIALLITVILPSLIIIFGFYFINKTIKEKSHSFSAVYIFGILFILILPITLGSLAFFGTLSPNEFIPPPTLKQDFDTNIASEKLTDIDNQLPDSCSIGPPSIISCMDWQADSSGLLKISLRYFGDYSLSDFTLIVGKKCAPDVINFKVGETKEFSCEIPKANPDERYKKTLLIKYSDNSNNLQEIPGKLRVTYK